MKMIMLLMMLADGTPSGATPDVQLLDFTASYCQPCQQMVPVLQRMERDKFPVRRIDITEEPELARRFRVDRVPTLVLMVEGKEAQRFVGLTDEAELRAEMNKAARRLAESRGLSPDSGSQNPNRQNPVSTESEEPGIVEAETPETPAKGRSSVKDIFRDLLGKDASPVAFEHPTLRGQSPESEASALTGLNAASAATVRVRVGGSSTKDGSKVQDVGTGTIIYSATGQAIVLTVAHVFLDIDTRDAEIVIELFENGKAVPYKGTLIGGDHNSDLALLKIQTSKILPSVRLTPVAPKVTKGQSLVSFGCNGGADPTRLETKIADIDRYDGPANLVCTTDPQSGRSGGGLFSATGELVGVCSCADRKQHEGLYMAYEPISKLVKSLKLQSILMPSPGTAGEDAASTFAALLEEDANGESKPSSRPAAPAPAVVVAEPAPVEFDEVAEEAAGADEPVDELADPTEVAMSEDNEGELSDAPLFNPGTKKTEVTRTAEANRTQHSTTVSAASGPEITIVIDDRKPGSQKKVIVIPQASPYMMELLTGESSDMTPVTAETRPAATSTAPRKTAKRTSPTSRRTLVP